ncbi:GlxA family transcriptional regulator [Castellaniella sp. GW247-6E4]|uniref:GlxA family transcriptional regulator n=1 Tax=Castellaniella sp. GW247-6E4 TaxID=3140380 RepID=UPI00331567FC
MKTVPTRFGFILLPQFTMTAFAGLLDVLRLSADEGDLSRPLRCTWEVIAETLLPVRSSSGVQVVPTDLLGDPGRFDYIVVVGGQWHARRSASPDILDYLRRAARLDCHIVGLCTGVFALAQAGVLAGHRVCVSWFHYWDFIHQFPAFDPDAIVADRLYVFDRRRITCSGGPASIDVAARILKRHLDPADVGKALRILQVDDANHSQPVQPLPPGIPPDVPAPVRRAVLLMQQHAGQALELTDLADRLGLSPRQLQRLFKQSMGISPLAYARNQRLRLAAWMLERTGKSIATVASDCGFSDAAHMGREFRKHHGMSPGAWRGRAEAAQKAV